MREGGREVSEDGRRGGGRWMGGTRIAVGVREEEKGEGVAMTAKRRTWCTKEWKDVWDWLVVRGTMDNILS